MDYYDQVFDQLNVVDRWIGQTFEQCQFKKLDLYRVALTDASFINCRFEDCNLTRAELKNTKLYDVHFLRSKLAHVDFGGCNAFGFHVGFRECLLDYAIFLNRKLKKAQFTECSMKEVHFVKCELAGTVFDQCNLELARFEANDLTQVDFASPYNLQLNPEDNKMKKARLSLHNLPGLLTKYDLVIKK